MSSPSELLNWFCRHAVCCPGGGLERRAQLLVLFTVAAEMENAEVARASGKVQRYDGAELASRRQQAENRRRAHFKSDNRVNT